jgi:hypothetical protein
MSGNSSAKGLDQKTAITTGACLAKIEPRAGGMSVAGSPQPMLQRKFDFTCPSGKNSSSQDSHLPAAKNSSSSFAFGEWIRE